MDFVVIVENRAARSQDEIDSAYPAHWIEIGSGEQEKLPEWECFTSEGRTYASWMRTPRYFYPELGSPQWESLRLYLVEAMRFFGSDEVFCGNDVVCPKIPHEGEDFFLPMRVEKELLAPPNLDRFPELAGIGKLDKLCW